MIYLLYLFWRVYLWMKGALNRVGVRKFGTDSKSSTIFELRHTLRLNTALLSKLFSFNRILFIWNDNLDSLGKWDVRTVCLPNSYCKNYRFTPSVLCIRFKRYCYLRKMWFLGHSKVQLKGWYDHLIISCSTL